VDPFCISSSILGSEKHMLVTSDGFTTLVKAPAAAWFLNGVMDPTKPLCLDSLLKLKGITPLTSPPEKWTRSMSLLASGSLVPWSQVLPSTAYKSFVKNLIKSIVETIDDLPKDYYKTAWCPGGQLLHGLKAAKVDPKLYKEMAAEVEHDSGAFETFRPGPGGFLQPVVYDRFATRTGRLVVAEGPNILTLKKKYRRVLKSTFPDGVVCALDFGALEARIILAEAGKVSSVLDLYGDLAEKLFAGHVDRNAVKTAVISELYGASKASLGLRLGIGGPKLKEFISVIQGYFDTASLRRRLKLEYESAGRLRNKYGRTLELSDPQDHLLINTYAQSTGVDVSLLGFKSVIDRLGSDGIRPLFVLHDALILDVRSDRLHDVESIISVAVHGYESAFPLKFERLQ
jgi:hypothetical protein